MISSPTETIPRRASLPSNDSGTVSSQKKVNIPTVLKETKPYSWILQEMGRWSMPFHVISHHSKQLIQKVCDDRQFQNYWG